MNKFSSRTILGLAVALALATGTASATNGYFSHGVGTKSKALAGAGSADPEEMLTIATNPAGLAFLPETVDAGLGFFSPSRDYKTSESQLNGNCFVPPGGTAVLPLHHRPEQPASENELFLVPFVAMNWKLNEQSALAVAFYGRGGMNTQWQGGTATFDPEVLITGSQAGSGPRRFAAPRRRLSTAAPGDAGVDLMQAFLNTWYAGRARMTSSRSACPRSSRCSCSRLAASGPSLPTPSPSWTATSPGAAVTVAADAHEPVG